MQKIIGKARAGGDEMLAVIENEQELLVALAPIICAESESGASSISQTPFAKDVSSCVPTSIESRVLPVPPDPVSVTRRDELSDAFISAISFSRPTKDVS